MRSQRILTRWSPVVAFTLGLSLAIATPAEAQVSKAAPASKSLARYFPADGLVFLAEYDGTEAHPAAWKRSAINKLLNETKLGAMVEDLLTQAIDQGLATIQDANKPTTQEVVKLLKEVVGDGVAFAVVGGPDPNNLRVALAFRDGSRNGVKALLLKADASNKKSRTDRRGLRTIQIDDDLAWWVEGSDVIVTATSAIDAVVAAVDGNVATAAASPIRAEIARPEAGFEPLLTAFLDFSKLPPMRGEAISAGLDGIKRVDYRWGFQDEASYSVLNVVAPAPRQGYLGLVMDSGAMPTFEKATLPPIPSGVTTSWVVASFSPSKLWTTLTDLSREAAAAGKIDGANLGILRFEDSVRGISGLRIKEDILAPLGPKWLFYADAEQLVAGKKGRLALSVELNDPAAAARAIDKIFGIVGQSLAAQAKQTGMPAKAEIKRIEGATPAYRIILPPGTVPPQFAALASPTVVVGKKTLAIGLTEADARAATAADKYKPGPEFASALAKVPGNLVFLSMTDPRDSFPKLIAAAPGMLAMMNMAMMGRARPGQKPFALKGDPARYPSQADLKSRLAPGTSALTFDAQGMKIVTRESMPSVSAPAVVPVAVALLLPAVQAAREAARRAQCVNNLRQMALAMHNFESSAGTFPGQAIMSKAGKPLLSWRVAILPFIEQQALYNEFHLDEPWDSAHNKALIPRMPATFACPSRSNPEPGTTTYLGLAGTASMLGEKPVRIAEITDGTSNTIFVAESALPVIWTKPVDAFFNDKADPSLCGCGSSHPGGFNAMFVDGSVRFLKNTMNLQTFKALVTRAGGEVISADAY